MQIRTVLVALADPGEHAQPLVDRAAQLAAAFDAGLVLFHAAFESTLSGRPFFDSKRLARSRGWFIDKRTRELDRYVSQLQKRGLTVSTQVVWEEPAYESIIRAAIRGDADLVVAGPHVRGRTNAPFSLRRNDWELLRLCPRPLLLVRGSRRPSGPVLAALDPTHSNDKPATLDRALAGAAAALAAAADAEFHAVHSIPPIVYALGDDSAASRAEMREKVLVKMRRSLRKAKLSAARIHILQGTPEKTIPELAKKLDAQLLVMGAISRRGIKRFAIGNTAERIIQTSPCDLLILKPDNFDLKLGRTRRESVILPGG